MSVHRQRLARVNRAFNNEYFLTSNVVCGELDVDGVLPRLSRSPAIAESFDAIVE